MSTAETKRMTVEDAVALYERNDLEPAHGVYDEGGRACILGVLAVELDTEDYDEDSLARLSLYTPSYLAGLEAGYEGYLHISSWADYEQFEMGREDGKKIAEEIEDLMEVV